MNIGGDFPMSLDRQLEVSPHDYLWDSQDAKRDYEKQSNHHDPTTCCNPHSRET